MACNNCGFGEMQEVASGGDGQRAMVSSWFVFPSANVCALECTFFLILPLLSAYRFMAIFNCIYDT